MKNDEIQSKMRQKTKLIIQVTKQGTMIQNETKQTNYIMKTKNKAL